MVEGKVEIFLSYKEPEYRGNFLWLRPYLDKEGYELLYYGANGWTRFIPCHPELPDNSSVKSDESVESKVEDSAPLTSIGSSSTEDIEGNLYEITSAMVASEKKTSCGCPN